MKEKINYIKNKSCMSRISLAKSRELKLEKIPTHYTGLISLTYIKPHQLVRKG